MIYFIVHKKTVELLVLNMTQKRILHFVANADFSFALIVANQRTGVDHAKFHRKKLKKRRKFIKKEKLHAIFFSRVVVPAQKLHKTINCCGTENPISGLEYCLKL